MLFYFYVEKPNDFSEVFFKVQELLKKEGGEIRGDEQKGTILSHGVLGEYEVLEEYILIKIKKKPLFVPNKLIEKEIKKIFSSLQ